MWFERNVMYPVCIDLRFECSGRVTDGFPKKKKLDSGWVGGLSSIQFSFGLLEFF